MATILSIDESTGTQGDDTALALPTALLSDLTALFPGGYTVREKAKNASGLTFAANTTDIGFTDGAGASLNGLDSGLLSIDGRKLFLYTYSGDNNLVIARAGTAGGLADPAGAISFVGYLQPNTASGSDTGATTAQLWVVEFGNLQHNLDGANVNDFVTLTGKLNVSATNPITFNADKAPSGSSLFVAYGDGTPVPTEVGVIVTAVGAVTSGNISGGNVVKASQAGASLGGATFGVNSQHFDGPGGSGGANGDAAYFTFVKGLVTGLTVPNLDQNESDVESNIGFSTLFGTTKVSFVVCQMQGPNYATVKISAMRASVVSAGATPASADDTPYTGNLYVDNQDINTLVDIDTVTIKRGNDSWTFVEGEDPPEDAPDNLTVDFGGDGSLTAVIAGAAEGDTIVYETVAEHNRLRIGAPGNSVASLDTAFDIGRLQIESGVTTTSPLGDIDFYDDGPTISGAATQPILAVDESDFTVDDTDAFAPSFTRAFGTDGAAASGSVTYALGIAAGASGVTDSASGLAVVLSLESGIVYGRAGAGGLEVFRISVDASGNVTLNQSRAVMHNDVNDDDESGDSAVTLASDGLVTLSSTVKDRDNDTQTAVLNIGQNIQLEDDGPTISASTTQPLLTVDESTLPNSASGNFAPVFTSAFGADGQAASNPLTYTLGINSGASGIKDTATGLDVVLSVVGGVVFGRAGTAANAPEVFRVSVDASGNVTLAQSRAVVHDNPADPDEPNPSAVMLAADTLVTLTARATDKDGDFKTATANIGLNLEFEDDGPGIGLIADGIVDFVKDATVSKSLLGVVGNDPNATPYTLTDWTGKDSDPADTIVIAGVTLKAVANAGATSVTYWANTNNDNTFGNAGDTAYYRLDLSQAGAGSYTFTVLQPPPVVEHNFTFADQPAGQNLFGIIAHDKGNVSGTAPNATLPDGGLLFFNSGVVVDPATGQYTNASSTVNTSKGGGEVSIGYGANNYTAAGQNAYFVFADNPNTNAVGGLGLSQTTADLAHTVRFEGTNEVTSAAVEIVKIVSGSPCGVTVRAYNLDPDDSASLLDVDDNAEARSFLTDPLAFGGPDNEAEVCDIVGVRIWSSNTTLTDATLVYSGKDLDNDGDFTEAGEFTTTGNVTVVKNDDGSFTVTSMDTNKNYTIRYDTTTPHDMARIDHVAGSYNIGGFNLVRSDAVPDQKFDFTARVTDGDGDTASDSWSVVIDGTGVWDDDEYTTEAPSSLAILPAFKDPGFVDDSGMFATLNHIDYFM